MIKKIIYGILILFALIIASAVIIPIVFKDKIVAKVKTEINNNVNAKVEFGDFSISILRSFPNLSFSLENLSVVGINEFQGDTLTSIKSLNITVDIMSVIKGEKIQIRKIDVETPSVYAKVLKNGKANWDISKPSADTTKSEPSQFKVALKKLKVSNGRVIYDDASMGVYMVVRGLEHTLTGDFTQDNFLMETNTTADSLSVTYGGVKYLNRVNAKIKMDLDANMPQFKFVFKDNEVQLNELVFGFEGSFAMPKEDMIIDMKFNAKKNDFKNFLSLVPAVYSKDFKDLKSSGTLAFNGFAKGTYNEKQMPAFDFNLQVNNGMFKYPSLPTSVNNVMVDLKVNNPDGNLDHTVVNLKKMHLELGKDPFDARLLVKTPKSDAQIDAEIKGTVNLNNIQQIVPLEKGTTVGGIVTADVKANGRMSQIEQKKYEDFKASGQISATNIKYASKDLPKEVNISTAQLTFNPKNVTLNNFAMKMGKSDFNMNGTLDNFIAYAIKKETLQGTLNFSSNLLDLTELSGESNKQTATAKDTTPLSVVEVPANIDFVMNASIGTLIYDNITMNNVKGALIVKDQTVKMNDLKMNLLDGSMVMNGAYDTKDIKSPGINMSLNINDFDIQKTTKTFVTVKKMAPIAEKCTGKYSSQFTMTGKLDKKMQPVLPTLAGGGKLSTKTVTVQNFEPINKVADALKMEKYKKLDLSNINISFKFKDGRVNVDPFDVKLGNAKVNIEGSNGFDQTIAYNMGFQIPRAEFGGAANNVLNNLLSAANSKGANLSVGETINVNAKVGGTVTKPSVSVGFGGSSGKSMADNLKDKAKEEFDKKKAELEAKAKAEADKYKKEAEDKVKAESDKAKAEVEKRKKEAEEKAKAEVEKKKKEAEDKAKKEAGNKIKGLFGNPK